jgi:P2-related tail formation protein
MLAMMAFVTFPAAMATDTQKLSKKLLVVKITNNTVKILNVKVVVKDVANNNKIVYVRDVNILSGNTITVQAPIVISGNAVNVCAQVLNAFSWQQCKAVTFGDTTVKTVSFSITKSS